MASIDAYREHDDNGPAPYRVRVRENLLRTARPPFTVRKFRTLLAACDAGKEAEAHAVQNHAKWEADKATAAREGITRAEAQARRIAAGG